MANQVPISSSAYPQPKRAKLNGCTLFACSGLIAVFAILCITTIFILSGVKDINNSPILVSDLYPFNHTAHSYNLSNDQRTIVDDIGYPDSFTILFYDDDFGGTSTRLETWIYAKLGSKYTFTNGSPEAIEVFDSLQGDIISTPYKPEQFTAYMSLEDLLASAEIDQFLRLPLEDELVPGGESYFADRLAFGLKDGQLMYVEVVGFEYTENDSLTDTDAVPQTEVTQPTPTKPPASEAAERSSFEDFIVEQGKGWLVGYWADSSLARSDAPLDGFDGIAGVSKDTPYAMAHAYMDQKGFDSLDAWLAEWNYSSLESFIVLRGFDLTYFDQADLDRFFDLSESFDQETGDIIAAWDINNTATIRGILDAHGYSDAGAWLDAVEIELSSINPQASQGDPFVYVSQRNDPNWPACEERETGCRSELFVHYPDSTGFIDFSLTGGADFESISTPAISHDGTRVAFSALRDDNSDIYVINIDGENLTRITSAASDDWSPAWSPDDDRIAFVSSRDGGNRQNIFIINLAAQDITQISQGKVWDRFIDWSPNGKYLAFNSDRADPDAGTCFPDCVWNLYMLRLEDGEVFPFPDGIGKDAAGITWSPDGKLMAFHALRDGQYDLFLIDDGFNLTRFSHTPNANEVHPAWSPDGTRLVFQTDGSGNWNIAITPISAFEPFDYTGLEAPDYYPDW